MYPIIWKTRSVVIEFSRIKTEVVQNKSVSIIPNIKWKQTHKQRTESHTQLEIQSHRISSYKPKERNKALEYFRLVFSLWRFLQLRSGWGGGSGWGSCLFVPEGPTISITSITPLPEPASSSLCKCSMASQFQLSHRAFHKQKSLLRCDGISELRAAVYKAQYEGLQIGCILVEICTSNTGENI